MFFRIRMSSKSSRKKERVKEKKKYVRYVAFYKMYLYMHCLGLFNSFYYSLFKFNFNESPYDYKVEEFIMMVSILASVAT